MKSEPIEVIEHVGLTINIIHDDDPPDPRGNDNVGTMIFFHRRYNLGDKHKFETPDDFLIWAKENDAILVSVYAYDHGGFTIRTSAFSDSWDSGQLGWIYVTRDKAIEELGDHSTTEDIEKILKSEVETYNKFLNGEYVGYVVEERGEHVSSCWGYDDKNYAIEEAKSVAEWFRNDVKKCDSICAL